jgi:CHAD domain-containing protein
MLHETVHHYRVEIARMRYSCYRAYVVLTHVYCLQTRDQRLLYMRSQLGAARFADVLKSDYTEVSNDSSTT